MADIMRRKEDHVAIVQAGDAVSGVANGFDSVRFEHCALPEIDLAAIDLSTSFLGRSLALPFLIPSMTGGPERAAAINRHLAEAAQTLQIALAVGSQRVALTTGAHSGLDRTLRRAAPDVPIYANLGAVQLTTGFGLEEARRAVEMIDADALILHLNPLQEAIQEGGDRDWRGVLAAIERLCARLEVPIVAKEIGCGISAGTARRLVEAGVAAIDVAGAGGTSWALVESRRSEDPAARFLGELFRDWGTPTAAALRSVAAALPGIPLIASGGIRHGLDAAKAIRLGATLISQAGRLLPAAIMGTGEVVSHLSAQAQALRLACFCTGSGNLRELACAPLLEPCDPG